MEAVFRKIDRVLSLWLVALCVFMSFFCLLIVFLIPDHKTPPGVPAFMAWSLFPWILAASFVAMSAMFVGCARMSLRRKPL